MKPFKFLSVTAILLTISQMALAAAQQTLCVYAQPNYGGGNTAYEIHQEVSANTLTKISRRTSHSMDHDEVKEVLSLSVLNTEGKTKFIFAHDSEYFREEVITINNDHQIGATGILYSTGIISKKRQNGFMVEGIFSNELLCVDGTLAQFYSNYTGEEPIERGLFYFPQAILGQE